MKKCAKKMGGNFYILPSSMHELLLLSDNVIVTVKELREMVHDINYHSDDIDLQDRLSDSIYHYNEETETVEIAE